ncbi:phage tail tape measure protein [Streptomyces sp. NPDC056160]|uniref:phage tail tape measure protein n=1 Tax=Streptomyces sp. NPDC056160 TaxID=3345731 RepID=UPI0035E19718
MSTRTTRVMYDLVARDNASKTFSKVGGSASKLEKTSVAVGAAIKKGLAVGTLALGGIGAASAKAATDFQAEMTRISSQAGGTTKDVAVLSDQVLKLGGKVQQGPQKLADSLFHLKAVGMDNASAMKALKEASDLAAVGHADLEQSANALAGAWRTGIKGATSFREAVSTVNAIIGAGNMSLEQFNAAIGTGILPSAKTFGLSLKQVGAALALMTDEGIDSASAATRLRMSFSLLGAPSGAAEKQLKKIGLTGLQLANAMRGKDGLIGALTLLKDHLDRSGMSAAQQSQLLSRAFGGGRSSSGILLMLNNLDVLEKKQEQINHSTDRYAESVKLQRKTAQAEWARLTSGMESMSVRLGVALLPPITSFVGYLNDKALPAASRFGRTLANLVPVGQIKQGFAEVESTVGGFLSGLTGGKGIGGFFKGGGGKASPSPMSKFPTTVLGPGTGAPHLGSGQTSGKGGAPLQAMPHYGVGQVAPTTGVHGPTLTAQPHGTSALITPLLQQPTKSSASPAALAMPHGGSGLAAPLVKGPKAAPPKSAAQQLGETLRKAVSGGIENIDFGKLGVSLGKGLGTAIGWVGQHTADFTKKIATIFTKIDFVQIGKSFGASAIPLAIGFITSLFDPLFSLDFWKKHWLDTLIAVISIIPIGRLASGFGKLFSHIPFLKIFTPLLNGIGKVGSLIEKGLAKVFAPIGRGIVSGIKKAFPAAASAVEREAGLITTRLGVWGLKLLDVGQKAARGIGTGIERGVSFVTEKALSLVKAVVRPFAAAGGWLLSKGRDVVVGLTRGIANRAAGIGTWVWNKVAKPQIDMFKAAGSWLLGKGKSFVSGLKNGAIEGAKGIGSWVVRTVVTPVVGRFSTAGSWLVNRGRSLVSGLKNGTVAVAKGIGGWVYSKVARPQIDAFKNAGSWLRSKGGALISGMKDGIVGGIKGIGGWVKSNIVDPVVNAVKKFFGIHSPSRVFMGIGGHLISGLLKGMSKTSGTAIAKKVFGSMPKALAGIVKKGLVSVSKLPGKALKALSGLGGDVLGMLGLGGGSGSNANQKIGETLAMARGWAGPQWAALRNLWIGESGWNERALNAASGAYGIPQALPASKMASAGSDWKTNPVTQIKWGLNYIASVYGNPVNAYSKWLSRSPHWYAKGAGGAAPGWAWVGEEGPELINLRGGETILSHPQSVAAAQANGIKLPGYASGTIQNAGDRVKRDRKAVEDAKDAVARAKKRRKGVAAAEKKLQAAEKELKAAEIALAQAKRSSKTSIANSIATGLQKTLSTGTASAIGSAIKSVATKLLNAGYNKTADVTMRAGSRLQAMADKKAAIESKIAAANQYAADQSSKISDYLSISGTSATSVGDLIKQMTGQQNTATNFVNLSKSLQARGASKELLAQLAESGPGSQLASILGSRGVTQSDISKLNSLVASGSKLSDSFGKSMADLMYDSGKDAGKGFLAGLKGQEKELQKQMDKLAKDLIAAIKRSLKIKSPSQVMRDQVGKQIALGMAVGMDQHRPHVAAAGRRLAATAYAASAGAGSARANAAFTQLAQLINSGQLGASEVHIHFDDPTLKDLIRVTAKPMIQASRNEQAYRAKVGRR